MVKDITDVLIVVGRFSWTSIAYIITSLIVEYAMTGWDENNHTYILHIYIILI